MTLYTTSKVSTAAQRGFASRPAQYTDPLLGIDSTTLANTLCELGRVEHLHDIGRKGPLVASAGSTSLFHCLFGRDAVRMAMDLLDDFPAVAATTLVELARIQGVRNNPRGEEEPGRIVHEHRYPEDAHLPRLTERWDFPYYGTVDTTPQWVNLLGAYCARVGSIALLDEALTDLRWQTVSIYDSLLSALGWIVRRLDDPAGAGYLWVRRATAQGIANQGWEDSPDSHYYEDGTLLDFTRPYAPVEVQGYTYDALLAGAWLLEQRGGSTPLTPTELRERAARLRARVLAHFWQPDLGTFAHALAVSAKGATAPVRVIASAPGHLLLSSLLDGPGVAPFREPLIVRLMKPDLLCGAGIRTKSTGAARFRAGSYHNGSSWPMDTGVIADGMRRHGRRDLADELDERTVRSCALIGGFPEFFRGETDGSIQVNAETIDVMMDGTLNRIEQPPQMNQGWTVTRVWRILRRRGAIAISR